MLSMIRPYQRWRDFEHLTGQSVDDLSQEKIVAKLEAKLEVERKRARSKSANYCSIRHQRLVMALREEENKNGNDI